MNIADMGIKAGCIKYIVVFCYPWEVRYKGKRAVAVPSLSREGEKLGHSPSSVSFFHPCNKHMVMVGWVGHFVTFDGGAWSLGIQNGGRWCTGRRREGRKEGRKGISARKLLRSRDEIDQMRFDWLLGVIQMSFQVLGCDDSIRKPGVSCHCLAYNIIFPSSLPMARDPQANAVLLHGGFVDLCKSQLMSRNFRQSNR